MTSVAGKKVVYPSGCKEVNEEIGKDELVRRLKVGIEHLKVLVKCHYQFCSLCRLETMFYLLRPNTGVNEIDMDVNV